MPDPVLIATASIDVPMAAARAWFLALADHPERYAFESHAGFVFTQGKFGEVGARFQTEERFAGILKLVLKFKLAEVAERRFTFNVISPTRGIWGYFELEPTPQDATRLDLAVGSDLRFQRWLLRLPPVRRAVQHQIEGEVAHIRASMASVYHSEGA